MWVHYISQKVSLNMIKSKTISSVGSLDVEVFLCSQGRHELQMCSEHRAMFRSQNVVSFQDTSLILGKTSWNTTNYHGTLY